MPSSEERMQVLKMIQQGTISAEQGLQLLTALEEKPKGATSSQKQEATFPGRGGRWFRMRVTEMSTGKTRVNIRMPISVLSAGMKMGARLSPEIEGMDIEKLISIVRSGETGQIVDVFDQEDGEHVEVFIE
ncbi:MAG: hypothetical protein ABFD14_07580 [Anaerolineaceae bacterium]